MMIVFTSDNTSSTAPTITLTSRPIDDLKDDFEDEQSLDCAVLPQWRGGSAQTPVKALPVFAVTPRCRGPPHVSHALRGRIACATQGHRNCRR